MEPWLRVADVAEILGCSKDTARARMKEMPDVINVGTTNEKYKKNYSRFQNLNIFSINANIV